MRAAASGRKGRRCVPITGHALINFPMTTRATMEEIAASLPAAANAGTPRREARQVQ